VIASAPHPAGVSILRSRFEDNIIHPLDLLDDAAAPTLVAEQAFHPLGFGPILAA